MRRMIKNRRVQADCKIYQMLKKQARKKHISFHTPGHKNAKWDITELAYSDNLSSPIGVIAQAEKDITALLGAHKSFIVTDGSTCGVLAMLHAAKSLGAKTILSREDAHKSLYNGCALLGLELLLLPEKRKNGVPTPLKKDDISIQMLERCDALFVTSPDYYGNVANLEGLSALCRQNGKLLLADGAHGGHLRFDKRLYAGAFADFWVDGVHKSLPALTQGAVVSARSARGADALKNALDIFRTSSPSYPVMASVEYAVKYPCNERLENAAKRFEQESDRIYFGGDWTKLIALFGKRAFEVEKRLQSEGIFAEFCDGNAICFYLSPALSYGAFTRLKKRLKRLFDEYPYERENDIQRNPAPIVLEKSEVEWVQIDESENRISAHAVGLFPPCTPLMKSGEMITKEKIKLLTQANNVFGLADNKIAVYKKEENI